MKRPCGPDGGRRRKTAIARTYVLENEGPAGLPQGFLTPSDYNYSYNRGDAPLNMRLTRLPPGVSPAVEGLQRDSVEDVGPARLHRLEAEGAHRLNQDHGARHDRRGAVGM